MRKKRAHNRFDGKIQNEIANRVFSDSEANRAEKEQKEDNEAIIDSLHEVSGLAKERIVEIAEEVADEHEEKSWKTSRRVGMIVLLVGACLGLLAIGRNVYINALRHEERRAETAYRDFIYAAMRGELDTMEDMLSQDVPIEYPGLENESALLAVAQHGNEAIIEFLLDNGADALKKDKDGKTPIDLAEENENIRIRMLLAEALARAAGEEHPVRALWSQKIRYSGKSFEKYVKENDHRVIDLFLQADRGRFAHNWDSESLKTAVSEGHTDVLIHLLSNGRDIRMRDAELALIAAAANNDPESIDALLAYGVNINFTRNLPASRNHDYFTPLLAAIFNGNRAVELLLEKGADPDLPGDGMDYIPLSYVLNRRAVDGITDQRRYEIAKALIDAGADVSQKDDRDQLPIDIARKNALWEIV